MLAHEYLEKALEALHDGRSWVKKALFFDGGYCAIGALHYANGWRPTHWRDNPEITTDDAWLDAMAALDAECDGCIVRFNNRDRTTFSDLKGVFCRAIEATRPKLPAPLLLDEDVGGDVRRRSGASPEAELADALSVIAGTAKC